MDWIEVTGRTVEEAVAAAAAELGCDVSAVEHEVIDAGKPGLFGRTRVDARIRARVGAPRRARSSRSSGSKAAAAAAAAPSADGATSAAVADAGASGDADGGAAAPTRTRTREPREPREPREAREPREPRERSREAARSQDDAVDQDAVAAEAIQFLSGLFEVIGVDASLSWHAIDDETLQVDVTGANLGFLVGRGGSTLQALQDLARLRVHHALGARSGRLMLDIAGYRQKRRVALEEFTDRVAAEVVRSGERRAMEPMNAVDRKVIHNRVGTIAGVRSESEGEEPNRRVVLLPA